MVKKEFFLKLGTTSVPFPKVHISLAITGDFEEGLSVLGNGSAHDNVVGNKFALVKSRDDEILFLESSEDNIGMLLGRTIKFAGEITGDTYIHNGKTIIVLGEDGDGSTYREIRKAKLNEQIVVICQDEYLDIVRGHLEKCSKCNIEQLKKPKSIPDGWNILKNISLNKSLKTVQSCLQPLNPLGASITPLDGLFLGRGTWHWLKPPVLKASSVLDDTSLIVYRTPNKKNNRPLISEKINGEEINVSLEAISGIPNQRLRASIISQDSVHASLDIGLNEFPPPKALSNSVLFHAIKKGIIAFDTKCSPSGTLGKHALQGVFVNQHPAINGDSNQLQEKSDWETLVLQKRRKLYWTLKKNKKITPFQHDIDVELAKKWLCQHGHGTQKDLKKICSKISKEKYFAYNLAKDLEALGYLETVKDDSGRLTEWQITPPTFVLFDENKAYFAGYEDNKIIDIINAELSLENHYFPIVSHSGLIIHRWKGFDADEIRNNCDKVIDLHEREMRISCSIGKKIARWLGALSESVNDMPLAESGISKYMYRYNALYGKWNKKTVIDEQGAYKIRRLGGYSDYVYKPHKGDALITSSETAKILAAKDEGLRLHHYYPRRKKFISALGVTPPGLYTRALVASSGQLPWQLYSWHIFDDIDQDIANLILHKLYS